MPYVIFIKKIKRYYASGTLYENIESNQLTDIIKPYLIDDFGNDTWLNVNKIAQAESLSEDQVIYIAKTLGYNIYKIYTKHKTFKIIAPFFYTSRMHLKFFCIFKGYNSANSNVNS